MPRRDGTGPMGQGPMTGRGVGFCNGSNVVGYGTGLCLGLGIGAGLGWCRSRGLGRRRGRGMLNVTDSQTAESRKEVLFQQKEALENRLGIINRQLENLFSNDK